MTVRRRAAACLLTAVLAGGGLAAGASAPTGAHAQARAPAQTPAQTPAKGKAAADKPKVKEVFPYWEHFLRIPAADRSRFQLAYYISADGKPLTGVDVYAADGGRREPIAMGAEGRARPPSIEFFRSKTAVIEAPAASGRKVGVNMVLQATAASAQELDAAEMVATLAQANAGIRKAAGPIGLVAPKMGRTIFVGALGGEGIAADGRRVRLPMVGNSPYFQPAALPGVRRLVLNKAPTRIALAPAVKTKG
jgi:hypothetical protein